MFKYCLPAMFRITALFLFLSLDETCGSKSNVRIKNGRDAKDGEFPYVVSFFYVVYTIDSASREQEEQALRFCTGSILTEAWILTAAHCVYDEQPKSFYIWHTNFTTSPLETKSYTTVQKIFLHPAYVDNLFIINNDISLILVDKLATNSFGRLSAVDHLTLIGLPVTYVGGGLTNKPEDDDIRPLQVGEAGIVCCSKKHGFTKYIICISPKCNNLHQRPWLGDSGGPLLYAGRIIGVTSFGSSEFSLAGEAFAAISPHIDWISNVMQIKFHPITPDTS